MNKLQFKIVFLCVATSFLRGDLEKVYSINQLKNAQIQEIDEYKDKFCYGNLPNVLDNRHLAYLNNTIDWSSFDSWGIISNKNAYIASIDNAFVAPTKLGLVFNEKQQLLFDTFVKPGRSIWFPLNESFSDYLLVEVEKIATVQGPTAFYHWLIDRMVSIFLLKDLIMLDPLMKFIINTINPIDTYILEYLELLGIPSEKIIKPVGKVLYKAKKIFFATPFLMEPIPRKLLLKMRNFLISKASKDCKIKKTKNLVIVIDRLENNRRLANIDEVAELIKNEIIGTGLELVFFYSNIPVIDQINLFSRAKIVIGSMASGLANVIYVSEGTQVIEFHPPQHHNEGAEWVWWLSSAVGADYWCIPIEFNFFDYCVNWPLRSLKTILQYCIKKVDSI